MIIHRFTRVFPITYTLIALLFFASSCFQTTSRDPQTIQVLLQGAPESIDPRFALSAYAATVSELIFASLLHVGDDLLATPLLAQSVEIINPVTFRIRLRPNLTFHDGSPLTASDVAFTFESVLDEKTASPHREKFNYLKQVWARDALTVDFVLKRPYAPFLGDLAAIGIVPKHQQGDYVGSGPFVLHAWNRNTNQITLTPHKGWFEGAPAIPFIELRVVKDPTTRLLELLKGNADLFVGSIIPKQLEVLKQRAPWLTISATPGLGYSYLAMNLRGKHKALANAKVRLAMAHAIDVDAIIRYKFLNLATRASGLLPIGHWAKSGTLMPISYDPQKARQLLDEAGFKERNEGRFSVTISTTTDRFRQSLAQIIASSLNEVGIKTTIRIQDWGSLFEDIKKGNFEMFSAQWVPVIEPDLLSWVFHSDNIPSQNSGGGNRGAYKNANVDQLLIRARGTNDNKERALLYAQVEEQLAIDLPYIPLWFENQIVIQGPRLRDFKATRTDALFELRRAKL